MTKTSLLESGVTESDLHWLVDKRYAEQIVEVTRPGTAKREFRGATAFACSDNACFVLSQGGTVYVEVNGLDGVAQRHSVPARTASGLPPAQRIRWNERRHELWVDGKIAKRFTHAARVQWGALAKFQLDGWKGPIEIDPSGDPQRGRAQRLRELVADLNRGLDVSLIHFRKDCEGLRITYDLP